MDEIENKILSFLESGHKIDSILKELNLDEENLADEIIKLEIKGFITLEDKSWILTQKGKDVLKEMKESLKKLKIEYLHGNTTKDEFQRKRKELETIIVIGKHRIENKVEEKERKGTIDCSKCGKENKIGSKYCYKCGESLKTI